MILVIIFLIISPLTLVNDKKNFIEASNLKTGTLSPTSTYPTSGIVSSVGISKHTNYLVAGDEDNKVYFFKSDTSSPKWTQKLENQSLADKIYSMAMSPLELKHYIAVGCEKKLYLLSYSNAILWNYTTNAAFSSVAISENGEYIAAGTSLFDNRVYLFNKSSSIPIWNYTCGNAVKSVAISPDGFYIVAGSLDNKVYLFNNSNGTPLWNYTTGDDVNSVAISSKVEYLGDKYYYIVAGSDKTYVFDNSTSQPWWEYDSGKIINRVVISPNAETIVAGEKDSGGYSVHLFNNSIATLPKKPVWSYNTYTTSISHIYSLAISSSGYDFVAGTSNGQIILFKRDQPTPYWNYDSNSEVNSVVISSNGRGIVAGVRIFDPLNTGKIYFFEEDDSWTDGDGNGNGIPDVEEECCTPSDCPWPYHCEDCDCKIPGYDLIIIVAIICTVSAIIGKKIIKKKINKSKSIAIG